MSSIDRKLQEARRELLETSTRSRLLSTPLGRTRAKLVELRDELSEDVFQSLVRDGKAMSFLPSKEDDDAEALELQLALPDEEEVNSVSAGRRWGARLQSTLSSAKLQARLRSMAYDAETSESEQGVNILYIALGFLRWYEPPDQKRMHHAPLILVPVNLKRPNAAEKYKVSYSGEEISTNLSLKERLREAGVTLPELPELEDLSPDSYLDDVSESVSAIDGWEVLPNAIVLGFFSFAKLLMYRDLDPCLWPTDHDLREHPVVGGLLGDGFREGQEPLLSDDIAVDPVIDIGSGPHVVDADSSQMLAIEDVRTGRNLVIQGPPGTGKSQTITNLVATAVKHGKTVLFVAEKMAALNVVRNYLDRVGLGDMCLELHSHKARKKVILEALEEVYNLPAQRSPREDGQADRLRQTRDALNRHVELTHTPLQTSGKTPFHIFGKLAALTAAGIPSPDFQLKAAVQWTRTDYEDRERAVERLAMHVESMGVPSQHPWRGVDLDVVLPQDAERLGEEAGRRKKNWDALHDWAAVLASTASTSVSTISDLKRLLRLGDLLAKAPDVDPSALCNPVWTSNAEGVSKVVEIGLGYERAKTELMPVLIPEAWDEEAGTIERAFMRHGDSWLRYLRSEYREALGKFKGLCKGKPEKKLPQRLNILRKLIAGQNARQLLRLQDEIGRAAFGEKWLGDGSDWGLLVSIVAWERTAEWTDLGRGWRRTVGEIQDRRNFADEAGRLARTLEDELLETQEMWEKIRYGFRDAFQADGIEAIRLSDLVGRFGGFASEPWRLDQWCKWHTWSREARAKGLDDPVDCIENGSISAVLAPEVFAYAYYEALARNVFSENHELARFDGRSHEQVVSDFKRLDRDRVALARREVRARHFEMIPRGDRNVGEVGVLAREWRKQRRHMPLRKLIKAAGHAMQRIKPVWMMSPMSLAQFVEPGTLEFDLVLMDEASQIRPVEALGAIARGRQLVVVGDDKQLPPTTFFDRIVAPEDGEPLDPDEFQAADIESILGLCNAQGIPSRMLRWHYRSQHESLIAVSNLEFYKRLFIFPSAHSDDLGLRFRKVEGIYDRGRTATNKIEAEAVARAVLEHALRYGISDRHPGGMSLGVGTFSVAQRDAILNELELLWREHPEVIKFFDPAAPEPFFVKNLESIQGDERDVVFISVGYGPDADGHVAMGFGPLALQGGERRLNVLISRARRRCEVYSSIKSDSIDLSRAHSVGVRVLKTFLRYAETGYLERSNPGHRDIDSIFEEEVGSALAALGYEVEHQVGTAGFFIDIGIRDPESPGRYLIGIECDGAAYHSSRSARDRDRLREEILRDRGWTIHRIWGLDWYRRRHEELQRVIAAIEKAKAHSPIRPSAATERSEDPVADERPRAEGDGAPADVDGKEAVQEQYVEASFQREIYLEPWALSLEDRIAIVVGIVDIEGPIHEEEVARRFATVCGKERAGHRIEGAAIQALSAAARRGELHQDGAFFSLKPLERCSPRDRSKVKSITLRKPEMLPPIEIQTGLRKVVEEHLGVESEEAIVETARLMGFNRTGHGLRRVIDGQLQMLLKNGVFRQDGDGRLDSVDGKGG